MQSGLFHNSCDPDGYQEHLLGTACIREYPAAFDPATSRRLLASLLQTIPWQQESLRIAGKLVTVPRLQCWMGDAQSQYGYSGIRLEPVAWQPDVLEIRHRVEELAGMGFNSVLLNYYRDGNDSVSWHADDERELGPDPVIASVSLGAARPFQLKPIVRTGSRPATVRLELLPGSLLIMGKGLQINWLHQLPKVKSLQEPRINLTFRQIMGHPRTASFHAP